MAVDLTKHPDPSRDTDVSAHAPGPSTHAVEDVDGPAATDTAEQDAGPATEQESPTGLQAWKDGLSHVVHHQLGRWWSAEDLTDEQLLTMLLNRQHKDFNERIKARTTIATQQLNTARTAEQQTPQTWKAADKIQGTLDDLADQEFTPRVPTAQRLGAVRRERAQSRRTNALIAAGVAGVLAWQAPEVATRVSVFITLAGTAWVWAMGRWPWTWTAKTPALTFDPDADVAAALEAAAGESETSEDEEAEAAESDAPLPVAPGWDPAPGTADAPSAPADSLAGPATGSEAPAVESAAAAAPGAATAAVPGGRPLEGTAPAADAQPYPIALATTAQAAADCLWRALRTEGVDVGWVGDGVNFPWGWQLTVRVRSGSPDDISANNTHKGLITRLRLPRGSGVQVEPWEDPGDTCTVRLVQRNPFATLGELPYRPPLSRSINDVADFGLVMDTSPLAYSLAGLMLLMVGDSGAAKSGIMLAMAEVTTACYDAVTFNIDPYGSGVADLGEAITASAHSDEQIIAVLRFFLGLAKSRARMRHKYRMGNTWKPSREHPAVCLFVDEWPKLSDEAKKLLIELLLVGRKEAIWVYAGSQFGTSDYLGAPIGPKVAARLLGACRGDDVTALLGAGALAEGYRADRLTPAVSPSDLRDAGVIYAKGLPQMPDRPVRYKFREVTVDTAARLGAERGAAGLPSIAADCAEAGLNLAALLALCSTDPDVRPLPSILASIQYAMEATSSGYLGYVPVEDVVARLREEDEKAWSRWDHMADAGARRREQGKEIARRLKEHGITLTTERVPSVGDPQRKITVYKRVAIEQAIKELP
ncbi:hypothetical protein [Streptomyces violascens]|uniref:hypothetical protein n=1 Tax=Streptomyces violascens TaxID=67381 RepID=UPI0016724027|nr:hypothetical protein [Streptomyces violascens]GGU49551.1 hypothetical protein GCM10010289_82600 [Streptomyces violascens]